MNKSPGEKQRRGENVCKPWTPLTSHKKKQSQCAYDESGVGEVWVRVAFARKIVPSCRVSSAYEAFSEEKLIWLLSYNPVNLIYL